MDEKEKKTEESLADNVQEKQEKAVEIPAEPVSEEESVSDLTETATEESENQTDSEVTESTETEAIETTESAETETEEVPVKKRKSLKKIISGISDVLGLGEMSLVRLIAAFFFVSGLNLASIYYPPEGQTSYNPVTAWKSFIPEVNVLFTVLVAAGVFLVLTLIYLIVPKNCKFTDQLFAVSAVLYFDFLLLWRSGDFYFCLGTMIVSTVLIYYAVSKVDFHKIFNKVPWWTWGIFLLAIAGVVAGFISVTTIATHNCFGTAQYDFGIFYQMFYSLIEDGTAVTSCERDNPISHFKIHASYIFYVLVPIFKLFPKAETLFIAQAVLAVGGVVPMFLIAKRHGFKGFSLFFMGLAYVFCIGIVNPCYYEFHENAFLPTVLMWLLWAVDRKNYVMFYIFSVLTCIVKEDAPLYVICIGLYLFFEDKGRLRRMNGLIMALFSGAYMLFITNWLMKHGDGQMMMSSRFSLLMIDTTAGLKEVVKNALLDPAYLFSLLIQESTLRFFITVMAPMLFIPFFTSKIRRFLLMIPFIVMNLVIGAGYGYAADIGFQYIFGPAALLLYMCVMNIDDMRDEVKPNVAVAFGAAAVIMTTGMISTKISSYNYYKSDKEYFDSLDEMLDSIPKDASVGTDAFLMPHVCDHKQISYFDEYDFDEMGKIKQIEIYDFVALPVRNDSYESRKNLLVNNGYELWSAIEGKCEIYVSPEYVQ